LPAACARGKWTLENIVGSSVPFAGVVLNQFDPKKGKRTLPQRLLRVRWLHIGRAASIGLADD
jgi:hypothetical protein